MCIRDSCGSANTIVLNNDPKDISKAFPEFFDMVLCDAPCSGEGMFRKEDQAVEPVSYTHLMRRKNRLSISKF